MSKHPVIASNDRLRLNIENCHQAIKHQVTINPHQFSANQVDLHVGWGADGDFLLGCEISMTSVALSNPENIFHFHLFTNDSHLLEQDKLQLLCQQHQLVLTIYTLDNQFFSQLPTSRLWSSAIYYRFIIAQYLSDFTDRMLYLDADVVCQGAVTKLIDMSLDGVVAAVVAERDRTWWCSQAEKLGYPQLAEGYFNSGVMLINLQQWAEKDILNLLLGLASDAKLQPKLKFFDQDLLNIALIGKKVLLSHIYNNQYSLNYELDNDKRKQFNADGVFVHFIGPTKPWHAWGQYSSARVFQHAKAHSPWQLDALQKPKSAYQLRYCSKHMLRQNKILKGYGYLLWYLLRKSIPWRPK